MVRGALSSLGHGGKFVATTVHALDVQLASVIHDDDVSRMTPLADDAARVREAVKAVLPLTTPARPALK